MGKEDKIDGGDTVPTQPKEPVSAVVGVGGDTCQELVESFRPWTEAQVTKHGPKWWRGGLLSWPHQECHVVLEL